MEEPEADPPPPAPNIIHAAYPPSPGMTIEINSSGSSGNMMDIYNINTNSGKNQKNNIMNATQKALSNYLILVKIFKIIKWDDRVKLKMVCKLWKDIIDGIEENNRVCREFYFHLVPNTRYGNDYYESETCIDYSICNVVYFPVLFTILFSNCTIAPERIPSVSYHGHNDYKQILCCWEEDCDIRHSLVAVTYETLGLKNTLAVQISQSYDSTYTYIPVKETIPKNMIGCGLVIPKIPGLDCHFVHHNIFDDDNSPELGCQENEVVISNKIKEIADIKQVKGALVFWMYHHDEDHLGSKLIQHLQEQFCDTQFPLAGARNNVNSCQWRENGFYYAFPLMVLLFTTPKNELGIKFNMFSLSIFGSMANEYNIKNKIRELSENIKEYKNSGGLLFYTHSWVKSFLDIQKEALKLWFPNTPVVGTECEKTISTEFIASKEVDLEKLKKSHEELSSVFVLFVW